MRIFALAVLLVLNLSVTTLAQAPYDDPKTPEGWSWAQIRNDQIADFNARCGSLDPHTRKGWDDPCRQISSQFLRDVLTKSKWRDQVPQHGLRLKGARINGSLDLAESEIIPAVAIDSSRIDGDLILFDSHWDRTLALRGSVVTGNISASRLRTDSTVLFRFRSEFIGKIDLSGAKIGGNLDFDTSSFGTGIFADGITVNGALLIRQAVFGGYLNLRGARIGTSLDMTASIFDGEVIAESMEVGASAFLGDHTTFRQSVLLGGTKVAGELEMNYSYFSNRLDADAVGIGKFLLMIRSIFNSDVNLKYADITEGVQIMGSSFARTFDSEYLKARGSLTLISDGRLMDLAGINIDGTLDLRGSNAVMVDLSEAEARELQLGGMGWWCRGGGPGRAPGAPSHWKLGDASWQHARCIGGSPTLILRNAHVRAFQDDANAWPPSLDLEGFQYELLGGLGGLGGPGRADMRGRSPKEWVDWLARDRTFSTQPYTALSSVLAAAGHRDTADAIQLAGRERERGDDWAQQRYSQWAWLTFLSYVVGYGIGLYTFWVLLWVVGLTVLGAHILRYSERARRKGYVWRLFASLHRLLPIIELSKEFTNFFDNPPPQFDEEPNLSRRQTVYFAVHAIAGWVLGFFLLAAMGGIIQKS